MGASETVLALEERAVVAETRGRANRLANADHANLVRTSRSARRSWPRSSDFVPATISTGSRTASRSCGAPAPPSRPESLRELAARADPPATKAAMHRRLRTLEELAEQQG